MKINKNSFKIGIFLVAVILLLPFLLLVNKYYLSQDNYFQLFLSFNEVVVILSSTGVVAYLFVYKLHFLMQTQSKIFRCKNYKPIRPYKKILFTTLAVWTISYSLFVLIEMSMLFFEAQIEIFNELSKYFYQTLLSKTYISSRIFKNILSTLTFLIAFLIIIIIKIIVMIFIVNKIVLNCKFFHISLIQNKKSVPSKRKVTKSSKELTIIIKNILKIWKEKITVKIVNLFTKILRTEKEGRFPGFFLR